MQCCIIISFDPDCRCCEVVMIIVLREVFSSRQHIIRVGRYYAIALPSVCLSITEKMVEVRIMEFSPYGSHIPLVFAGMRGRPKFHLKILRCPLLERGRHKGGEGKISRFYRAMHCSVKRGLMSSVCLSVRPSVWGYRGGSPTAVQAWQPCPLWELSPSHPILLYTRGLAVL